MLKRRPNETDDEYTARVDASKTAKREAAKRRYWADPDRHRAKAREAMRRSETAKLTKAANRADPEKLAEIRRKDRAAKARARYADPEKRRKQLKQQSDWQKHKRATDPEWAQRERDNMRRYRIGPDAPSKTTGICPACGRECDGSKQSAWLVCDHNHHTGFIRGMICTRCNTAAGMAGDNAEGVRRLLAYLEDAERREAASVGQPTGP